MIMVFCQFAIRISGRFAAVVISLTLVAGCEESQRRTPGPAGGPSNAGAETSTEVEIAADTEDVPAEDREPEFDLADVGADDAQAGSTIGGGIITEPLHQRFHISHRIQFMMMKDAMNKYRAMKGHYPKSHEEFMKEIIEVNRIELPELQGDWEYFYDVEDHELKKRREAR